MSSDPDAAARSSTERVTVPQIVGGREALVADVRDFFATFSVSRWILLVTAACAAGASIGIDATTNFWIDLPFTASFISGLFLLVITVVLVAGWVDYQAAQTWTTVAAFALEDVGRVTRAVLIRTASFVQPLDKTQGFDELRRQLGAPEGEEEQWSAMEQIANERQKRAELFDLLYDTAKRTRELIIDWAPVMVSRSVLAEYLSRLTDIHRRMSKILQWLSYERAGRDLPVSTSQLRDEVLRVCQLALSLEDKCFTEADDTAALSLASQLVAEDTQELSDDSAEPPRSV